MRVVLLRLKDDGEPQVSCSYNHGVLTMPSLPIPPEKKPEDPLYTVRLVVAAGCPVARDGLIWTNCPESHDVAFDRNKFHKKYIRASFHKDDFIDLDVYTPGSYCFYLSYRNEQDQLQTTRRYYFVVPPVLYLNDKFVPLNSIALQSVVSKWMGKDWDPIFHKIDAKGYNMIHFTPLQERGESNSPYSIYDQLAYDPEFFQSAEDVKDMVQKLHKTYNILTLTDVVYNHTANNSAWLLEHPESGYNHITAPHLLPAIELDKSLLDFSKSMKSLGYPTNISNAEDLLFIMDGIKIHVLGSLKLWEFYVVDIKGFLEQVTAEWESAFDEAITVPDDVRGDSVRLAGFVRNTCTSEDFGSLSTRFGNSLIPSKFITVLKSLYGKEWNDTVSSEAHNILNEVNLPLYKEYDEDVRTILDQLYNRIKYLRVDDHGPKLGPVTPDEPLTEPYFTRFLAKDGKEYALANNGWIWDSNPLVDFASNESKAYLRREVIVWGDCVKLRYGLKPEDSPYLWERMSEYTRLQATIFDGFRIDNCHSTPLHVGEYFLDLARKYNPNLYVVAELFSGSEQMDCIFVEKLAISSLIREAMQAWSEQELSSLVHRHGGRPTGSYKFMPLDDFPYSPDLKLDENFVSYKACPENELKCLSEIKIPKFLSASPPHALFMDCTHDNETPYQKRTVEDTLPNAALVGLSSSAIGTVYGYDEIYPHLLDVVKEKRQYSVVENDGISIVKKKFNEIRATIATQSDDAEDSEMHVHHDGQFITYHRTHARLGDGYYLIARTKFSDNHADQKLPSVTLSGSTAELLFSYSLVKTGDVPEDDGKTIKGIATKLVELEGFDVQYDETVGDTTINLPQDFPAGSIAVFKTKQCGVTEDLDEFIRTGALRATEKLDLHSLNAILYRCHSEESDISANRAGIYTIPDYGPLVYCGLQGWVTVLRNIIFSNDLAHPLSKNLRLGHWALDYVVDRLDYYRELPGILEMQQWLKDRLDRIKKVPYYLVPRFFALVIGVAYEVCRFRTICQMSENIGLSNLFVQSLAMTSVQMTSVMTSTSLLPDRNVSCIAAGLPHFSTQYMRCWGRDVFISLRGLFLTTGRFAEAKNHILAFAKTLKHGLIPNLLDAGRNPRYNARDAAWFFVQSIQDYIETAPDGASILKEKVTRRFPKDDRFIPWTDPEAFSYESTIEEILYEIVSRHAKGIKFREANAGPNLDRVMKSEGFDVEVYVDWETGLVFGGSQYNCGTWMDKMGESEQAGTVGVPGTPRDGAAVEINGLLKSCLRFLIDLKAKGLFEYDHVEKANGDKVTLKKWNDLLLDNFEKKFYVPASADDDNGFDIDAVLVNRRGIYKDLYKSGKKYEDYQLRPNFTIAMTVAPELFTPKYAYEALNIADEFIRGPVGMKTLDPSDYNYRPYYRNSEDSADFQTAKGRNYHQGPEWVWCYGYFLRAYNHFHFLSNPLAQDHSKSTPSSYLYQQLYKRLDGHRKWIRDSEWAGLTELTNKDGDICHDSSPTQAWSTGCLLDFFYDLWDAFEE
ncbi:unnamed protein product [Kluyveromyces dobzhanskii CBS 2104]|uniref:Glycogen debranching enzyme n=1 Tax=Kluyveromyces dobzhanskii CBS 2104 TaxID=1427455 RepID=A0A0A8L004_9SACH|nr:unnamed protein product [Kluyveromyces dobzhanskii CBS 2104]